MIFLLGFDLKHLIPTPAISAALVKHILNLNDVRLRGGLGGGLGGERSAGNHSNWLGGRWAGQCVRLCHLELVLYAHSSPTRTTKTPPHTKQQGPGARSAHRRRLKPTMLPCVKKRN